MDYPIFGAVILTDPIFELYGGVTGSSTGAQRNVAYWAAEMLATQAVGTFLTPTIVTGTFAWPYMGSVLVLPQTHILGLYSVVPQAPACSPNCDLLNGTACAFMQDAGQWGYLILRNTSALYGQCCPGVAGPIDVQIVYQAGLVSGSSYQPTLLLGLTKVAQMILNEIIDPGANEGGEGDPGVLTWSSSGHSEVRKTLANTVMGNSAVMNFANRMFGPFRPKRCLKLGW
jgi:hypothetical protein